MPIGHNGINRVHAGRASWVPGGVLYRGAAAPARIDPADWSPRGRYQLRAWRTRVDARLATIPFLATGETHRP